MSNLRLGFIENLPEGQLDRFQSGKQSPVFLAGQCGKQVVRIRNLSCANQLRTPQRARVCNSFGEPFFELRSIADVVQSKVTAVICQYNLVQ